MKEKPKKFDAEQPDENTMKLFEERLAPVYRLREREKIQIRKRVTTEHKTITVALRREELVIEHLATSVGDLPDTQPIARPFEDETWVIPLYQERVDVKVEPFIREEVRITRKTLESSQQLSGIVRSENIELEEKAAGGGSSK